MATKPAKCPACGATIEVDLSSGRAVCVCGKKLRVRLENELRPEREVVSRDEEPQDGSNDEYAFAGSDGSWNSSEDPSDDTSPGDDHDWDERSSLPPIIRPKVKKKASVEGVSHRKADRGGSSKASRANPMTDLIKSPAKATAAGVGILVGIVISRLAFGWLMGPAQPPGGQPDQAVVQDVKADAAADQQIAAAEGNGYFVLTEAPAQPAKPPEAPLEKWFHFNQYPPATPAEFDPGLPEAVGSAPVSPRPEGLPSLTARIPLDQNRIGGRRIANLEVARPEPDRWPVLPTILKLLPLGKPAPDDPLEDISFECVAKDEWGAVWPGVTAKSSQIDYPGVVAPAVSPDDQFVLINVIGGKINELRLLKSDGTRIAVHSVLKKFGAPVLRGNRLEYDDERRRKPWLGFNRSGQPLAASMGRVFGWTVENDQLKERFGVGDTRVEYTWPIASAWGRDWLVMTERALRESGASTSFQESRPGHIAILSAEDGRVLLRSGLPPNVDFPKVKQLDSVAVSPRGDLVAVGYLAYIMEPTGRKDRNNQPIVQPKHVPLVLIIEVATGNRSVLTMNLDLDGSPLPDRGDAAKVAFLSTGQLGVRGFGEGFEMAAVDPLAGVAVDKVKGAMTEGIVSAPESDVISDGRRDLWVTELVGQEHVQNVAKLEPTKYRIEVRMDELGHGGRVATALANQIVRAGGAISGDGHVLRIQGQRGSERQIPMDAIRLSNGQKTLSVPTVKWEWELLDPAGTVLDRGLRVVVNEDIKRFSQGTRTSFKKGGLVENVTSYDFPANYQDLMFEELILSDRGLGIGLVLINKGGKLTLASSKKEVRLY